MTTDCCYLDKSGACTHNLAPTKLFGKTPCIYTARKRDLRVVCSVKFTPSVGSVSPTKKPVTKKSTAAAKLTKKVSK